MNAWTPGTLALKTALFFIVLLISLTFTELLLLGYRDRWYAKQDDIIRPACERIQAGMAPAEVWQTAEKMGQFHVAWEGEHTLGFGAVHGSCTVLIDSNTHQVIKREFSQPTESFIGAR